MQNRMQNRNIFLKLIYKLLYNKKSDFAYNFAYHFCIQNIYRTENFLKFKIKCKKYMFLHLLKDFYY